MNFEDKKYKSAKIEISESNGIKIIGVNFEDGTQEEFYYSKSYSVEEIKDDLFKTYKIKVVEND